MNVASRFPEKSLHHTIQGGSFNPAQSRAFFLSGEVPVVLSSLRHEQPWHGRRRSDPLSGKGGAIAHFPRYAGQTVTMTLPIWSFDSRKR